MKKVHAVNPIGIHALYIIAQSKIREMNRIDKQIKHSLAEIDVVCSFAVGFASLMISFVYGLAWAMLNY